jgi:hypothetical protein
MKATSLKGNFNVTPEQLSSIYSFIKETLNPLSANGSKVLEFASKAEKVGKYSGMPMEELKEKTALKEKEIEAAIEELVTLDILSASSYKELYQLNPQNIPQVFSIEAPQHELTLNLKLTAGEAAPKAATKAAPVEAEEVEEVAE